MGTKQKSVISNLIWRFAERSGAQGVSFIVSIILARLLYPEAYGTIALVTVFTTILQVFVDSGLGNALIQKKDADNIDFSTVFFFNIGMCSLLYIILYVCSPLISSFYKQPELIPVIRVLGLTLIISGVKNIQQAYVSKHLLFKCFFFATLGGTIGAALIGIIMAYLGFGVWALVAQQLFNTALDTIILWIVVKWRPDFSFSFQRLKRLFSFGWKLLLSSLIDTVYNDIRQLIIGKIYSSSDLAYFNRGKQFPYLIVVNINNSIDSVLFPVLSENQNDTAVVKRMTQKSIRISSYIMWPLMIGLAVVAKPLVILMLTEKWIACVPLLQIFCLIYGFFPIHTANLNAIKALGRSDMFLKLEIIKKILGLTALLISIPFGISAITYSMLISTILSSFVNAYPNRSLMNYKHKEQLLDILPSLLLAVCMGILIWPIQYLNIHYFLITILQVGAGCLIYITGSKLLHFDSYEYILTMVKSIILKNKKR